MSTELATQNVSIVDVKITEDGWHDAAQNRQLWKSADVVCKSSFVPQHFKDKTHDVFMAMQMAIPMKIHPITLMQNMAFVRGIPVIKASFQIALANTSKIFNGRIKFKVTGEGDNLAVTAYTKLAEDDSEVSATVTMKMAKLEGWTSNPKYASLGEQMLVYRAATFLIRRYAPEVLTGLNISEEMDDIMAVKPVKLSDKLTEVVA